MQPIIGFIPCRLGSERVKNKNTRRFASYEHGLLELKLLQMSQVTQLDRIIVSSNDPKVLEFAEDFRKFDPRVTPLVRSDAYGHSGTSMEAFTIHISEMFEDGIIFWTHVTHPFLKSDYYNNIIESYKGAMHEGHDSLVTVTQIHKFIWSDAGPYNYSSKGEKWPRSQDLLPLYEINHGVYMLPFSTMRDVRDRVGRKPFLFNLPESVALDVDWEDQFNLLNDIALARQSRGESLI